MIKVASSRALLLLAGLHSGATFAAGFALNEQSASALGQAFAGRASMAADASTVYGNPAGMTYLERPELSGGFAVVHGNTDIDNVRATFPGTNDGDPVPTVAIPFGYYVQPLGNGWSAGLGIYVPFGLTTDYESSFQGRYFGTKSELTQIAVQPTVAYRFSDEWSVGFGITYNWVEGELARAAPSPLPGGDIYSQVTGEDSDSWGFNVGVIFSPTPDTRIGLTHHSEVDLKLTGETKLNNYPVVVGGVPRRTNLEFDASLDITLPATTELALTQRLNDVWTLHATALYTSWETFDEINIETEGGGPAAIEVQEWRPTWTYAVGTSMALNPQWTLRAGVAYDETPTNNEHRSVRVPSGDRWIFSVGAGWALNDNLSADFSYGYILEDEISINQTAPEGFSYSADFESTIHVVAAQLNYRF